MKKLIKGLFLAASVVSTFAIVSCSDESPFGGSDSEGSINLNFSTDGRVMRSTRADDSISPVVPGSEAFGITLEKIDGSFSKNWGSVDAFNRENAFPIGDYNITASYGDVNVQGFEAPCYTGSASAHVSPGATTEATIVATLANAMVSVRYTDQFKSYFKAYSSAVQTAGHDLLVFAQNEDRPAYIEPGESVKVNVTVTNANDETVTLQPAQFNAVARHHYVVSIGLEGNSVSGNLGLTVVFEDEVQSESVVVNVTDDLFKAPAPSIKTKGCTTDVAISAFENVGADSPAEFDVFAFGGLKATTLNVISSNGFTPAFGKEVQLVNAEPLMQAYLKSAGVICSGFFRNVDKMGVVDVTEFIGKLPAGTYEIQLQAVDMQTRTSDPVSVKVNVEPVDISAMAVGAVKFMSEEITIDVSSNCEAIKDKLTFQAPDRNGVMVDARVKSVVKLTDPSMSKTRTSLGHTFRYVLEVAPVKPGADGKTDVMIHLGSRTFDCKVNVAVPEYSITPDAFAHKVVLKIEAADASETAAIADNLQFYNGSTLIPSANITHGKDGFVTIVGLTKDTEYSSFKASMQGIEKAIPSFRTETDTDVTNGTFGSVSETINIESLNVGGKYRISFIFSKDYQHKSSIVRSTPDNWADVNELTCWLNSANKNTWYMVPSTFAENGEVVVRSVGYNHNGPDIPLSDQKTSTRYYCDNSPSEADLHKAAGELFLGSYPFLGSSSRTDGISFSTRPSSVTFDYSYAPVNGELAEVYIRLLDIAGDVIGEKTEYLSESADMKSHKTVIPTYAFGKKAAKIQLGFKSTRSGVTPAIVIPTGTQLDEGQSLGNKTIAANKYHAFATGSVLRVDNVKLGYEATENATATFKRTGKRGK
ncbi:MAG: DUF4493 domain-containing protein [Candidatus Amulumruptor caecigallinarius]|nr:DUF4493 domain-containing protein [Candidatus Amulumruptor caecigallinarius]